MIHELSSAKQLSRMKGYRAPQNVTVTWSVIRGRGVIQYYIRARGRGIWPEMLFSLPVRPWSTDRWVGVVVGINYHLLLPSSRGYSQHWGLRPAPCYSNEECQHKTNLNFWKLTLWKSLPRSSSLSGWLRFSLSPRRLSVERSQASLGGIRMNNLGVSLAGASGVGSDVRDSGMVKRVRPLWVLFWTWGRGSMATGSMHRKLGVGVTSEDWPKGWLLVTNTDSSRLVYIESLNCPGIVVWPLEGVLPGRVLGSFGPSLTAGLEDVSGAAWLCKWGAFSFGYTGRSSMTIEPPVQ